MKTYLRGGGGRGGWRMEWLGQDGEGLVENDKNKVRINKKNK